MNDFTKEELEIILLELSGEHYLDLKSKIQSMIDSYCDHQAEPVEHEICCIKCQKTLL